MRKKWLVVAGAAVVVAVVGVVVVVATRDDGPPAVAAGPGVFRLHPQYQSNGGVHAPTALSYRGTTFKVGFWGTSGSGDASRARLDVTGPGGTSKPTAMYAAGAVIQVDGAALKVRQVYTGGSDLDDVVDLQVVPQGR